MRSLLLIAAIVFNLAALAGCSLSDCAYYGGGNSSVHCVITGPSPTGGYH